MKISCPQENLAQALAITRRVARNSVLPIMSHVVLTAKEDGWLRLSAANTEFGINVWIGSRVEETGTIAAPAATLTDLVKTYPPDKTVRLRVTPKGTLQVTCDNHRRSNIKGMSIDEELLVVPEEGENEAQVDAAVLHSAIDRVAFAAAPPVNARPVLAGVQVRFREDRLTLAAADGYRASICSIPLKKEVAEPFEAIVPATAMRFLSTLCRNLYRKQKGQVTVFLWKPPSTDEIFFSPTRIIFRMDRAVFASQLISGTYPNLDQLIPQDEATYVVVKTAELLQAVKVAGIFARDRHLAPVCLSIEQGHLTISGEAIVETGNASVPVPAEVEGEDTIIHINLKILLDALTAIGAEKTILEVRGVTRPFLIRGEEEDTLHLLMPLEIVHMTA